jgi:hypothetical protein
MLHKTKNQQDHLLIVDLADNIMAQTTIPIAHHAALRAGFAGYPPNPRWNVSKFQAWKTGQKWQEALQKGEMIIRTHDQMLVEKTEQEQKKLEEQAPKECLKFSAWAKQLVTQKFSLIINQ